MNQLNYDRVFTAEELKAENCVHQEELSSLNESLLHGEKQAVPGVHVGKLDTNIIPSHNYDLSRANSSETKDPLTLPTPLNQGGSSPQHVDLTKCSFGQGCHDLHQGGIILESRSDPNGYPDQ